MDFLDGFYFKFDRTGDEAFFAEYSPGGRERREIVVTAKWDEQLKNVEKWTRNLLREFQEPDLWTSINDERKLAEGASQTADNSPFTPDEQKRLAQDVREIKEFLVRTYSVNQEQAKFVDDRLNYLTEASDRLGRKDWINLTLSVLMTIIIGLSMPPDASRELLRFAGQAFNWLLVSPLYLPV